MRRECIVRFGVIVDGWLASRFGLIARAGLLAAIALPGAGKTVSAQPLPPSWSGFYLGGSVGARWSQADVNVSSQIENYLGGFIQDNIKGCPNVFNDCFSGAGFNSVGARVGPFAGINWQLAPRWIVGLEADWAWADQTGVGMGARYPIRLDHGLSARDDSFIVRTSWEASSRLRVGYLVTPSLLVFATGGVAWMGVDATSFCGPSLCPPGGARPTTLSNSATLSGPTIGAGIEALLGRNWIARAEYRYADFGAMNATDVRVCSPVPSAMCGTFQNEVTSYDVKLRTHAATVGIAYKFDWGALR